jgi:hypothetical protein
MYVRARGNVNGHSYLFASSSPWITRAEKQRRINLDTLRSRGRMHKRFAGRGLASAAAAQARVKDIAQGVAEEVEGEDQQADG